MNKQLACQIAEELVYMIREVRDNPHDDEREPIGTPTSERLLTRNIVKLLMEIGDD